jgi:hypothetical protein
VEHSEPFTNEELKYLVAQLIQKQQWQEQEELVLLSYRNPCPAGNSSWDW